RGAARLPLRRLRQPAAEVGDPRRAARPDHEPDRAGTGDSAVRARRHRRGPLEARVILGIDSYASGWLDLVFRWFHVTAAIVWIGTSFYFVALDQHLHEPREEADRERGVGGESWEIHGGGFYRIEKFLVAPKVLPKPLHWYKWEA